MTVNGQIKSVVIQNDSIIKQFYQYNIKYPTDAKIARIQGTIILTFDLDSTCSFINRRQDIELGFGCDDAAWETLNKMEKEFKKNNDKKSFNIPVVFRLR